MNKLVISEFGSSGNGIART